MAALCEHLGLSLFREGGRKAKQGVQQIPLQGEFATAANIEVERILDGIKAEQEASFASLGDLGSLEDPTAPANNNVYDSASAST